MFGINPPGKKLPASYRTSPGHGAVELTLSSPVGDSFDHRQNIDISIALALLVAAGLFFLDGSV
jgi:hypothetical protein